MTEYDLGKVVGDDGEAGNGIASITKTGTSGLVDTYTITYDDGTTTTFTVTNGSNASVTIQTSWGSTTSDSKVPSEKLTKDTLDTKIAKSSTSGLVKNDGTIMTSGTGSTNYSAGNHTHSGYISTSSTTGLIKNDGTIMTSGTGSSNWAIGNHTHSGYVSGSKVTSWSGTVSDSNIPSEKLVKNSLDDKIGKSSTSGLVKNDGTIDTSSYLTTSSASSTYQTKLVSGTSIKTINNESLLGSGNISISGGGTNGEYFFSKDSFFDPNQWTGSPTISNGVITLSSDATFPLRLPPNCVLSFDLTVTNGYYEEITLLGASVEVNYDWFIGGVADLTFTSLNNSCVLESEATGDYISLTNVSSRTSLSIPVTSGCTATISNVVFTDTNRGGGGGSVDIVTAWESTPSDSKVASEKLVKDTFDALENLIGDAITYINGSGS